MSDCRKGVLGVKATNSLIWAPIITDKSSSKSYNELQIDARGVSEWDCLLNIGTTLIRLPDVRRLQPGEL